MKLIRQMSVTAVMLALGLAASASQHLSTRFPDSKPQARTYNLLADEAALFKTPRMGMVVNLSEEGRLESPASNVRPPMAVAPPPGYNVRLQGCNLRPAGTDATSVVIFRAHPDHGMTAVVSGDQFRANGGGCYVGDNFYYIGYTQMFGMNLASFYHYNATTWEAVAVKDAP